MMTKQAACGPLRVCIVNEFFYPDDTGGTGTVLSDLADTLRRDYPGVEIDVITSNNLYRDADVKLPTFQEWNGIRIFRLDTPYPGGLSAPRRLSVNAWFGMKALAQLRRLPRHDLVLVGTAPPTLAAVAQVHKAATGTPYLYVVYDLDPDRAVRMGLLGERHPLVGVLRRCQRRWLHAAAKVVVLGRCMQDYVGRSYGLLPGQIQVIPIGGDAEAIRPQGKQTAFRARHGLNGFVALYSGNFGRYHNFDTVLDAARHLRDEAADVTFVLVGGGAQKPHILDRVAHEGLCNVRVLPFVGKDDYPDLLASADASLVTLEPGMEGLCVPSKFYSILASGRPTIAMVSPASEVAQVIHEHDCGLRVDQSDADGLVRALSRLAADPAEAERMGRNARAALVAEYDNHRTAQRYYETILSVLGREAHGEAPAPKAETADPDLPPRLIFSSGPEHARDAGRREALAVFEAKAAFEEKHA